MAGDGVQRGADLVGHLRHDAAGERQPLRVAEPSLSLVELAVEMLDLTVAPVELAGRFADPREQLVVEPGDARHHLVEVVRERAELVGRRHRHGAGRGAVARARDRRHEPTNRPVHDVADGDAHQGRHDQHRRGAEGQRPEVDARRQLVTPPGRELHRDGAGDRTVERDRGDQLPVTVPGTLDQARDRASLSHLVPVLPAERQPDARLARRHHP